jgi:radical SAM protein with 4Fe4S-binding SPASM domain
MPMELLNHVLSELYTHGYQGRINPYLMAEPLCDERILDVVKLIRYWFPNNNIRLSTNGDLLDGNVCGLLKAGVSTLYINHYDLKELGQVEDETYPQVNHFGLMALMPSFYNRAGHVDVFRESKLDRCPWPNKKLYINWQGDVILCCSDYNYEVVFGNLRSQPLDEIYNAPAYLEYRDAHLNGGGKHLRLCKDCNLI